MCKRMAVFLAVPALAFAPAPLPRPATSAEDQKRMQGAWVLASILESGAPGARAPDTKDGPFVVRFAGDRVTYADGQPGATTWAFTLGQEARNTFDSRILGANGGMGGVWPGVYELKGDTLRICYAMRADARPRGLQPNAQGEVLHVLKRQSR
jgi:uncharacterized protein (TIGR03067 family)